MLFFIKNELKNIIHIQNDYLFKVGRKVHLFKQLLENSFWLIILVIDEEIVSQIISDDDHGVRNGI